MSYIRDIQRYEEIVFELLVCRYELLESVDMGQVLDWPREERKSFLSRVMNQDSKHWTDLIQYLLKSKEERAEIGRRLYQRDPDLVLPAVKISTLLEISKLSDEERRDFIKHFRSLFHELIDTLDQKRILKTLARRSSNVQATVGVLVNALYKTCEHLNRLTSNFSYFFSWLHAEFSQEVKSTVTAAEVKNSPVISLDETIYDSDDTTLHERVGFEDEELSRFEEAERAFVAEKTFVEYLKEHQLDLNISPLEKAVEEAESALAQGKYSDVLQIFENDFLSHLRKEALSELKELLEGARGDVERALKIFEKSPDLFPKLRAIQRASQARGAA